MLTPISPASPACDGVTRSCDVAQSPPVTVDEETLSSELMGLKDGMRTDHLTVKTANE